jgi:hypothetical protein
MISNENYALVYDDFVVPAGGWTLVGVFSNNYMNQPKTQRAHWIIRSGMSEGRGGKVVASKTSPATLHPRTPVDPEGYAEYEVRVDGLNVKLEPGRYWFAVAPIAEGLSYINATAGGHAIGTPRGDNGEGYFDRAGSPSPFVRTDTVSAGVHDSSQGVRIAARN